MIGDLVAIGPDRVSQVSLTGVPGAATQGETAGFFVDEVAIDVSMVGCVQIRSIFSKTEHAVLDFFFHFTGSYFEESLRMN